jgi:hypothetical protein
VQSETDPEVGLWLMIVGAVAVFSEDDKLWFKPMFTSIAAANQLKTWEDMHLLAGSFLWVGIVYDKPAETIFRQLMQ